MLLINKILQHYKDTSNRHKTQWKTSFYPYIDMFAHPQIPLFSIIWSLQQSNRIATPIQSWWIYWPLCSEDTEWSSTALNRQQYSRYSAWILRRIEAMLQWSCRLLSSLEWILGARRSVRSKHQWRQDRNRWLNFNKWSRMNPTFSSYESRHQWSYEAMDIIIWERYWLARTSLKRRVIQAV